MEIEASIRQYILENFLYSENPKDLRYDISLFDNDIIDSTGVLEVVGFIEETFDIQVADTDLVPEHFDSVDKITAYINGKIAASPI